MDENVKKKILLIIALLCLTVSGVIIYKNIFAVRSGSKAHEDSILMKCANCSEVFKMTPEEYLSSLQANKSGFKSDEFPCPKCGKKTAFKAIKCSECGFVYEEKPPVNKCPECGHIEK